MPTAMCLKCQRAIRWRNQRGTRLADLRCPQCGSGLVRAMWAADGHLVVPGHGGHPPEKFIRCVICGRRRKPGGMTCQQVEVASRLNAKEREWRSGRNQPVPEVIPAGSTVCWHHQLEPVDSAEVKHDG